MKQTSSPPIKEQFKLNKWIMRIYDRTYARPKRLHAHLKARGVFARCTNTKQ